MDIIHLRLKIRSKQLREMQMHILNSLIPFILRNVYNLIILYIVEHLILLMTKKYPKDRITAA